MIAKRSGGQETQEGELATHAADHSEKSRVASFKKNTDKRRRNEDDRRACQHRRSMLRRDSAEYYLSDE